MRILFFLVVFSILEDVLAVCFAMNEDELAWKSSAR